MYAEVLRRVILTTRDWTAAHRVAALAGRVVEARGTQNSQSIVLEINPDGTFKVIRATLMRFSE